MKGWLVFIIILLLLVLGYLGYMLWARIRANRLGLPPPSWIPFAGTSIAPNYPAPAPGGIRGWIDTQVRKFKNRRYATGAYEEPTGYSGAGGRGRGAGHRLDPDEAWDARVGNEAYYEEQELGLHAPESHNTAYTGVSGGSSGAGGYGNTTTVYGGATGYPGNTSYTGGSTTYPSAETEPERGRSRTRDYDGSSTLQNPFGDDNAASLRGVSPRPLDTESAAKAKSHHKKDSKDSVDDHNSPTERRSIFRENM